MMKVQKGQVQYKDRNDYYVTYGIADGNKTYYFITKDIEKLKNGNRIATTVLVEAIDDMVKASHVGLVTEDGVEKISFDNRRIKLINDNALLVEVAEAKSQSVIDAVKSKNDPTAATTLVSTTTAIKDKINAKMSPSGRFIFNDLFSEATICDIDGNNLVGGEYYSFIANDGDKLYLSKNLADSDVVEVSLSTKEEVKSNDNPVVEEVKDEIKVEDVSVDAAVVDNALNNQDVQESVTEDAVMPEVKVDTPVEEAIAPIVPDASVPALGEEKVTDKEEASVPVADAEKEEATPSTVMEPPIVVEDKKEDVILEVEPEVKNEEVKVETPVEETVEEDKDDDVELKLDVEDKTDTKDNSDMNDDMELNLDALDEEKEIVDENLEVEDKEDDPFKDSSIKVDTIAKEDDYMNDLEEVESFADPDIADGTKIITGLIKQNRELKSTLAEREAEIERKDSNIVNLTERDKMQRQKIEVLTDGRKRDRGVILKLQGDVAELEKKVHYLERINAAQSDEISMLKPQVQGKEELVKLYAEAEALLGEDDSYNYDDYLDSYRKAA